MHRDLRKATTDELASAMFDHAEVSRDNPWHFGDVEFEVDQEHQLHLLADLFLEAPRRFDRYSAPQVETGLWCMMSGSFGELFCGLVWESTLPIDPRQELIGAVYSLYDRVLAAAPYEAIDFRHPDATGRRYETIDYMAPDLLLDHHRTNGKSDQDAHAIRKAFLDLFIRLLGHPAPVARYAGLHGLGHLEHSGTKAAIDRFLEANHALPDAEREYAMRARAGDVL